jgi:hypothetical protein
LLVAGSRAATLHAINSCGGDEHTLRGFYARCKNLRRCKTRIRVSKVEPSANSWSRHAGRATFRDPGLLRFFRIFDLDQGEGRGVTYLI